MAADTGQGGGGDIAGASTNSSGSSYWSQVGDALATADGPGFSPDQQAATGQGGGNAVSSYMQQMGEALGNSEFTVPTPEQAQANAEWWSTPQEMVNPRFASAGIDAGIAGLSGYVAVQTGGAAGALGVVGVANYGYSSYQNLSAAMAQPYVFVSPNQFMADAFHYALRP
jgi:hypothetical protein